MKDVRDMREMLRAMQSGELTVSRGMELLDLWLAGNYSDNMLPPVREGLGEDEMPWDRIDAQAALLSKVIAERDELLAALSDLCDIHDKAAGVTIEQVKNREEFGRIMDAMESRVTAVVTQARAAIAKVQHATLGAG